MYTQTVEINPTSSMVVTNLLNFQELKFKKNKTFWRYFESINSEGQVMTVSGEHTTYQSRLNAD